MNQRELAERSAELIIRYYDNDWRPFLEAMDDDARWYGPAEGQFLHGRQTMIAVWEREEHTLTFTLGNLQTTAVATHAAYCDVMLQFTVVTHYPDGQELTVLQRILLTWCERAENDGNGNKRKVPRILVCHIANLHGKSEDDVIYAKRLDPVYHSAGAPTHRGNFLHFHAPDNSEYYFLSDTILYIEAAHRRPHAIIHTLTDSAEVLITVPELEKQYPGLFLRCHQSYLVNPLYLRHIKRFRVVLTDGTELPIPEKKYTAFRDRARAVMK